MAKAISEAHIRSSAVRWSMGLSNASTLRGLVLAAFSFLAARTLSTTSDVFAKNLLRISSTFFFAVSMLRNVTGT